MPSKETHEKTMNGFCTGLIYQFIILFIVFIGSYWKDGDFASAMMYGFVASLVGFAIGFLVGRVVKPFS